MVNWPTNNRQMCMWNQQWNSLLTTAWPQAEWSNGCENIHLINCEELWHQASTLGHCLILAVSTLKPIQTTAYTYTMQAQLLQLSNTQLLRYLLTYYCIKCIMPSVLWHCWLGGRKGIRPVKNRVLGCWHGYLSGARCRLAYDPADATATHCLLLK